MRGESNYADYVLYYKPGIPLAIIEAKDRQNPLGGDMPQAIEYAELADVPFAFSIKGDGFLFHDKTMRTGVLEREIRLDELPSPDELWDWYTRFKELQNAQLPIVEQPYYASPSGKAPRYYQLNAINRAIEAIAKG